MCGIAGALGRSGPAVSGEQLAAMGLSLAHRGPDAQGSFVDAAAAPAVALVHRRLSIIDLTTSADHPLPNEDGSVQVLLNGEIYNYRELRAPLAERHRFRSSGDTEVIAHLYEERGVEAISALDGMFAIALWDARQRRLLLATDRFGKKPLYYWTDGVRFLFGSEIKALLAAGVPAEMEERHLAEYLAVGYVPTPDTLFRGIRKLPPASTMIVDAAGAHPPRPYWRLQFPRDGEARPVPLAEATDHVASLLSDAVRKRLIADVPLGLLLSGGLDSSVIAAIMARLAPGQLKTFTVGFEGHRFYDERPHAERVARHVGALHESCLVRPDAAALLDTLLQHHDEPFGDSSALPTYLVAQQARRHVTVVLNGDGGDESFAGYGRFEAVLLAEKLPRLLRTALGAAAAVVPDAGRYHGPWQRARRFARKAARPFDERLLAWSSYFDLESLHRLDAVGAVQDDAVLASFREALREADGASLLSRLLHLNFRTYLVDDLLPKMDRMTMAHGLEARSPFLDTALVEYVAGLPDDLKRQGREGKVLLKSVAAGLLPLDIVGRKKHGFGLPIGDWFRNELRPLARDALSAKPRLARWLRVERIDEILREHQSGAADRGPQLWTLLTLELWLRKHGF
jgi:asparagine synthase (glutamine-hydrolysing)